MIHPSYNELYNAINNGEGEKPILASRYSVCIATAKRARQIISGQEPLVVSKTSKAKPLSTAVQEIFEGKVTVENDEELPYEEFESEEPEEGTSEQ